MTYLRFAILTLVISSAAACGDDGGGGDADSDVDADTDADTDSDSDACGSVATSPLFDTLLLNEVQITADDTLIEVANVSGGDVTLDRASLCTRPAYWTIPNGVVVPAGGFVTFHYAAGTDTATDVFGAGRAAGDFKFLEDVSAESGEFALYDVNNSFDCPGATEHMVDYVRWGAPTESSRESEASTLGIWTSGETVDSSSLTPTSSLARQSPAHTAAAWSQDDSPTPGAANE